MVAPNPISNAEFSKILAASLGKPCFFKVPSIALKTLMCEQSRVVLDSIRVYPKKLLKEGFKFKFASASEYFNAQNF